MFREGDESFSDETGQVDFRMQINAGTKRGSVTGRCETPAYGTAVVTRNLHVI